MSQIIIRNEQPQDYVEIDNITRLAFFDLEKLDECGIGACEPYMVHQMRGDVGIPELTFVALIDKKIVGHVIFTSGSYIETLDNQKIEVLNFGPISVHPDYQKKGIGSMLMKKAIENAIQLNYNAIFFYGHPTYYPRFGFKEAAFYHITTKDGINYPAFMGMELIPGCLTGVKGKFFEPDIYDEKKTINEAKIYENNLTVERRVV